MTGAECVREAEAFLEYASANDLTAERAWRRWTEKQPWDPGDAARVLLLVLGRLAEARET